MNRIENAIRDAGGLVRIPGENGKDFAASIQPLRQDGDNHTEIGMGGLSRYKIYAECCDAANSLKTGSMLEFNGKAYVVDSISTHCFRGRPVFRQGILTAVQEGE